MADSASPRASIGLAAVLAAVAVGTWSWHAAVIRTPAPAATRDPWELAATDAAVAVEAPTSPPLAPAVIETVVQANPFSPKRRLQPPARAGSETPDGAAETSQPLPPQFIYKGRVKFGASQRAIIEETTTHKTYFLEVGQEVAGFKVLDIAENRVVLSQPQSNEPLEVTLTKPASGTAR